MPLTPPIASWRRRPGLALALILTLALGLGATATVLAFVDALLLRPLPYAQPERLVAVFETSPDDPRRGAAPANFLDWRRESRSMTMLAATFDAPRTVEGANAAERVRGASVSANFFAVLGARPVLGRSFAPAEDGEPGARRVVLSDALWRRQYGADRDVIGQALRIDGVPHEVVGVMPASFASPTDEAQLWMLADGGVPALAGVPDLHASRDIHYFTAIGRLATGATVDAAQAEFAALGSRLARAFPETNRDLGVSVVPLRDAVVGDRSVTVFLLLGVVGLVLLIAGANAANLMISATAARAREFAVRGAVGATRAQIVRPVLLDGAVIALAAGGVGLAGAAIAVRFLRGAGPFALPSATSPSIDLRVAAAGLVLSALVGVLSSLVPALRAGAESAIAAVLRGGRGIAAGGFRLQRALAVVQLGLSLALLIGAGILVQRHREIADVDPGFRADGLTVVDIALSRASYGTPSQLAAYYARAFDAAAALPGVQAVSAVSNLPTAGGRMNRGLRIVGRPSPARPGDQTVEYQVVAPGYFATMGVPVLAGRAIEPRDDHAAPAVAVINEAARRRYWPDSDPLGAQLQFTLRDGTLARPTIVGVVADVRHFGLERSSAPEVYVPLAQDPVAAMSIVIRAHDAMFRAADAQASLRAIDPSQPVSAPRAMRDQLRASLERPRVLSRVLTACATVALALAAIGLYGLLAQVVHGRTRELGVRLALGAIPRQVVVLVLKDAGGLVGAGVALGVLGALALSKVLKGVVVGARVTDPAVFLAMAGVLTLVGAVAALLPAARAARLQPARVLGASE